MGALTSTTNIPPAVQSYYDRSLLMRALPGLVHMKPATRKSLKRRNGNTMVFRRIEGLPLATTALLEGQPPAGKQLSKTDITCTIQQWGDYVTLTDMVQATVEHPVLNDANKVLGEQAGQTVDVLMRDTQAAGSNKFLGGNESLRSNLTTTTHKVDTNLLDRMIRFLRSKNAKMFTEMVDASTKQATFPIRPAYLAITTPEVQFTLETLPGYVPAHQYASTEKVMDNEIGSYKELRFMVSTQAKSFAGGGGVASGDVKSTSSNADVHTILVFGQEACAAVPLEGGSLENIIKPLGAGGTGDPLNQLATSGWKHTGARVRLNESFMLRGEVTVGDVAP